MNAREPATENRCLESKEGAHQGVWARVDPDAVTSGAVDGPARANIPQLLSEGEPGWGRPIWPNFVTSDNNRSGTSRVQN